MLTPHAGELGALLGSRLDWVDAHRLEAARRAAERFGASSCSRAPDTLVAAPGDGRARLRPAAPPSLATAGTGDVLTGVVAAFLAKGLEPRLAAAAAAVAHTARRRELVRTRPGLIASDLLDALPAALDA